MITFKKIENDHIFADDFRNLERNNTIEFSNIEKNVVIYGPNGTGKTSLIKVLAGEKNTKISFIYDGQERNSCGDIFHIISDQNSRNIIQGETQDFFLGADIRREFELQEEIKNKRESMIALFVSRLKDYGISSSNSKIIELIEDNGLKDFIKDVANSKSRGKKFSNDRINDIFSQIDLDENREYDNKKLEFIINDIGDKNSIIAKIEEIEGISSICATPGVMHIEENNIAIDILKRFDSDQCIVCDTEGIERQTLIRRKTRNINKVIDSLDENTKNIIEGVIVFTTENDPFLMKKFLLGAMSSGNCKLIHELLKDIRSYKNIYDVVLSHILVEIYNDSGFSDLLNEYNNMMSTKPDITQEDELYLKEIISNGMDKELTIERDENKNLRILLSNSEVLGKDRDELPLSSGEQNFLSLTFEFLRARNSTCPIVVVDDPISSFDSIYKNKITYAVLKMLHEKKCIMLTHNIDLLRLLDSQYNNCYNLYILNNTSGEENGFIKISSIERKMLISIEKLIKEFSGKITHNIVNVELFLISMVPFMRGYASIIADRDSYEKLTQLMHGYKSDEVDIAKIYSKLFNTKNNIPDIFRLNVEYILNISTDIEHIVKHDAYPLLDKVLRHSFMYLYLRLRVEKTLVEKFNLHPDDHAQLGKIISDAFPDTGDHEQARRRVRLLSKKTLINEFNHFEGNLSIFQPAIDITDKALSQERDDIISFIMTL